MKISDFVEWTGTRNHRVRNDCSLITHTSQTALHPDSWRRPVSIILRTGFLTSAAESRLPARILRNPPAHTAGESRTHLRLAHRGSARSIGLLPPWTSS